jgi:tail accessory factor
MTQVATLVRDALVILGVRDAQQPIPAVDMEDGIRVLNMMVRRFEANGMTLGWTDVSSPSDELPLPPEAEEAIAYNLAVRLRSRYQTSLDPDVLELARQGLSALRRDVKVASPLEWDPVGRYYDIRTDSMV